MTRHLSDNFPPPLSSESRPEGHPLYGHRKNNPLYASTKALFPFYGHRKYPTAVDKTKKQRKARKKASRCKKYAKLNLIQIPLSVQQLRNQNRTAGRTA